MKLVRKLVISIVIVIAMIVVPMVGIIVSTQGSSFGITTTDGQSAVDWIGDYGDATLNNRVPLLYYPVISKKVTSGFGIRTDPITGEISTHRGTDYACSSGEIVKAPANGTVISIETSCTKGDKNCGKKWGNYVKLELGNKVSILLAHLSKTMVSVGDTVIVGQRIGLCGNTGWSSGYHVHFELYIEGTRYNVAPYLEYTEKYKKATQTN